jgi:hypothetical protein
MAVDEAGGVYAKEIYFRVTRQFDNNKILHIHSSILGFPSVDILGFVLRIENRLYIAYRFVILEQQ